VATRTAVQSVAHTWGIATQETHPYSSVSLSYVNAGTPAKAAACLCVQVPSQVKWKGHRGERRLDVGHSSKPSSFSRHTELRRILAVRVGIRYKLIDGGRVRYRPI